MYQLGGLAAEHGNNSSSGLTIKSEDLVSEMGLHIYENGL